jgi:uncharacterized protein YneR
MTKEQYNQMKNNDYSVLTFSNVNGRMQRRSGYMCASIPDALKEIARQQANGGVCLIIDHSIVPYDDWANMEGQYEKNISDRISLDDAQAAVKLMYNNRGL